MLFDSSTGWTTSRKYPAESQETRHYGPSESQIIPGRHLRMGCTVRHVQCGTELYLAFGKSGPVDPLHR